MTTSQADDRFLDSLYSSVTNRDDFVQSIRFLQEMFRCKAATLVTVDARNPSANILLAVGILHDRMQLYIDNYANIDPAPGLFMRLPAGTATSTNRMFTADERKVDRFYNEFFVPIGLTETLAGPLYLEQGSFAMVALMRGDDRPPFHDHDIAHLERLMPHIARALQLRHAFFRLDAKRQGLQVAVDRQQTGIVLIDDRGEVLFANPIMQTIAQRGDGFALERNGRPLPTNTDARRRFDALLDSVLAGDPGGIVTVPRTAGRDYAVLITTAPPLATLSEWDSRGASGAIIIVHNPEQEAADTVGILAAGLGLPSGAARLVASLVAANDLKSFADSQGITINTARFHMRTALTRTGTRTQAELVGLAVRLLRDLALAKPPSEPKT